MKLLIVAAVFISTVCFAAIGGFYVGRQTAPASQTSAPANDEKHERAPVIVQAPPSAPPAPPSQAISTTKPAEKPKGVDLFAERAAQPIQTLTDADGRFIKAKILEVDGQTVKIKREDGLEFSFPMSKLSDMDIQFCEYLSREGFGKKKKKPNPDDIDWDAIFGS